MPKHIHILPPTPHNANQAQFHNSLLEGNEPGAVSSTNTGTSVLDRSAASPLVGFPKKQTRDTYYEMENSAR